MRHLTPILVACALVGVPSVSYAQSGDLRDGAGNRVPRNYGTPGRSGSYSGTGYAGGSADHGLDTSSGRDGSDNHFGDRVR